MKPRSKAKSRKVSVTKQVLGSVVTNKKDHQKLITKFHTLNKTVEDLKTKKAVIQKTQAHHESIKIIEEEIMQLEQEKDNLGGLAIYQKASLIGEKRFNSATYFLGTLSTKLKALSKRFNQPIQLLDVGALGENYFKEKSWISATAIDLHPTCNFVKQADFFKLPLSGSYNENPEISGPAAGYDVIALSLVLNFVGDPIKRGQMITKSFSLLKKQLPMAGDSADEVLGGYLYVVMPLPCISNSRYMNEDHYCGIFHQSGFKLVASKTSPKLAFHIFRRLASKASSVHIPKTKLRDGPALNNFTIVL